MSHLFFVVKVQEALISDWTLQQLKERLTHLSHAGKVLTLDIIPKANLPKGFKKRALNQVTGDNLCTFLFND